jgi:diadenosine tetraphosphate (Ap4A) HIT family hydrolase
MDCLICVRDGDGSHHSGTVGGNVYQDAHWYAYHAPAAQSTMGQLFLVSRRHYLDHAEMTESEAASYGCVLRWLVEAIKQVVDAERVYVLTTVEGVPHFHARLVPRPKDAESRGWTFVAGQRSCSDSEALAATEAIREQVSRIVTAERAALGKVSRAQHPRR